MNAQTRRRRRSASAVITIGCIALSVVAPLAALAEPTAPIPQTLESKVSLADLDLSTPEGVRAAHKRLRREAEFLCRQLGDSVRASYRWTYAACVKETLASAIRQLNAPALAAFDHTRSKP